MILSIIHCSGVSKERRLPKAHCFHGPVTVAISVKNLMTLTVMGISMRN